MSNERDKTGQDFTNNLVADTVIKANKGTTLSCIKSLSNSMIQIWVWFHNWIHTIHKIGIGSMWQTF